MIVSQKKLMALAIGGLMTFAIALPSVAISDNAGGVNSPNPTSPADISAPAQQANQGATAQAGNGRLADNKKQVCQQSEQRIQNTFRNMNQLGEGQYNLFNKIQERVKAYYNEQGLAAENFADLEAKVEQARVQAENAVMTMTQTSSQFGCDKDDPKGVASQYKVQVKTQVDSLKEYRGALKDLLAAVKATAAEAEVTQEEQ